MPGLFDDDESHELRSDWFLWTMIGALFVGVYTSLILITLYTIALNRGAKALFSPLILLMLIMYACTVLNLGQRWQYTSQAFIEFGETSDSVAQALATRNSITIILIFELSRGVPMVIADCIMIWRCWTLYARSRAVVIIPVLLVTAELAVLITMIVLSIKQIDAMELSDQSNYIIVAHGALTLSTTVLLTILIVVRIVRKGGLRRFRGVIEIIVESSALYAMAIIAYVLYPIYPNRWEFLPNAVLIPMPGITSTLVIMRVALGQEIERTFVNLTPSARSGRTSDSSGQRFWNRRTTQLATVDRDFSSPGGIDISSKMTVARRTGSVKNVSDMDHPPIEMVPSKGGISERPML